MITLLSLLTLQGVAQAEMLQVTIEGMVCVSCEAKVSAELDNLSFLSGTKASTPAGSACAQVNGDVQREEISRVLTDLGYTLVTVETVENCDSDRQYPANWADTEGLDVRIISLGEEVSLADSLVADKFTIFDFGAPWCAPCHVAEKFLKTYLSDHPDVAVRAIILNSQDANISYQMPVVSQHLSSAPGLPFFIVMNPAGKTIARGVDLPKVLKKLDRKR